MSEHNPNLPNNWQDDPRQLTIPEVLAIGMIVAGALLYFVNWLSGLVAPR